MLVKVVAVPARKQNNTALALEWIEKIQQLPYLTFVPLDGDLARKAAQIAARHRLRGSDAVYVAVARRFNAAPVMLDSEPAQRVGAVISVCLPAPD